MISLSAVFLLDHCWVTHPLNQECLSNSFLFTLFVKQSNLYPFSSYNYFYVAYICIPCV
uniref:Uncharacterized protein n=1 Tax=Rhizophora mucronata TaxID=61149 RepID=A0A2P2KWZ9_RHIMU